MTDDPDALASSSRSPRDDGPERAETADAQGPPAAPRRTSAAPRLPDRPLADTPASRSDEPAAPDEALANRPALEEPEWPEEHEISVSRDGARILVSCPRRFDVTLASGVCATWKDARGRNLADEFGLGPWLLPLVEGWQQAGQEPLAEGLRWDRPPRRSLEVTQEVIEQSSVRVVIAGSARWLSDGARTGHMAQSGRIAGDTLEELSAAARPPSPRRDSGEATGGAAATSERAASRLRGQRGWADAEPDSEAVAASLELSDQADALPRHEWRYSFYPSGEVFVHTRATGLSGAATVGAVLTIGAGRTVSAADDPASTPGGRAARFQAVAQRGLGLPLSCQVDLPAGKLEARIAPAERGTLLIAAPARGVGAWEAAHLLVQQPLPEDGDEAAAVPLGAPPRLRLISGTRVATIEGDLNRDGYNEGEGVYELVADGGLLSFELDADPGARASVVVRIHEALAGRPYVFINGRPASVDARDALNRPLLRLRLAGGAPLLVEVHTAPRRR